MPRAGVAHESLDRDMGALTVGSLFTGIGGFDLGLERAGMRVLWQCEADEFCRRVLAAHWPHVPCYPDVSELRGADVEPVDVLCGGFPCQDISVAGKGAGIDGARSGLWAEYARLVGELRPSYVVVENVPALLGRGLGRVLGDLAALGYDAEWDCLPACAFGAPHRRDRIWIVAYPGCERGELGEGLETWTAHRDRVKQTANNGNGMGVPLTIAVQMWPTIRSTDGDRGGRGDLIQAVRGNESPSGHFRTWPTPTAQDAANDGGPSQMERSSLPLNAAVKWATPKAHPSGPDYARRENGGALNPTWVEWLMGFPLGWTDLGR